MKKKIRVICTRPTTATKEAPTIPAENRVKRIDFMVKAEFVGNGEGYTMARIKASAYDMQNVEELHRFEALVDIRNLNAHAIMNAAEKHPKLFTDLCDGNAPIVQSEEELSVAFAEWMEVIANIYGIDNDSLYLWSGDFKNVNYRIVDTCLNANKHFPIPYKNHRDMHTFMNILDIAHEVSDYAGQYECMYNFYSNK